MNTLVQAPGPEVAASQDRPALLTQAQTALYEHYAERDGMISAQIDYEGGLDRAVQQAAEHVRNDPDLLDIQLTGVVQGSLRELEMSDEAHIADDLQFTWDSFEKLAADDTFKNHADDYLLSYLDHYRVFIKSVEDPQAVFGQQPGLKSAHVLYAAVESAYHGDMAHTEELLGQLDYAPHLQSLLRERLAAAQNYDPQAVRVSDQESAQHLQQFVAHTLGSETLPDIPETAAVAVSINTSLETAEALFDPFSSGRYLSVHEHDSAGGHESASRTRSQRNQAYRQQRRSREESLGHERNIFLPPPVYGALTDERLAKGGASPYGDVVLYPKLENLDAKGATYTWGDSLDFYLEAPEHRTLNAQDARKAYQIMAANPPANFSEGIGYIEAQIPGLHMTDLAKIDVTYRFDKSSPEHLEDCLRVARQAQQHGVESALVLSQSDLIKAAEQRGKEPTEYANFLVEQAHQRYPDVPVVIK